MIHIEDFLTRSLSLERTSLFQDSSYKGTLDRTPLLIKGVRTISLYERTPYYKPLFTKVVPYYKSKMTWRISLTEACVHAGTPYWKPLVKQGLLNTILFENSIYEGTSYLIFSFTKQFLTRFCSLWRNALRSAYMTIASTHILLTRNFYLYRIPLLAASMV